MGVKKMAHFDSIVWIAGWVGAWEKTVMEGTIILIRSASTGGNQPHGGKRFIAARRLSYGNTCHCEDFGPSYLYQKI